MPTRTLEPHAIFLDFDGTLGDHGVIPPAHVDALRRVRDAGHHVFLCTGRPEPMVPADVQGILDGLVCGAGCYVKYRGEVLADHRFEHDVAEATVGLLTALGAPFVLESPEGMFGNARTRAYLETLLASFGVNRAEAEEGSVGGGGADIMASFVEREDLSGVSFAKAVVWQSPRPIQDLTDEIGPTVLALPNSLDDDDLASGEIQLSSVDKVDGMRLVANRLGIPLERTVACGDGMNDVGMLRGAGVSVVIAGSPAERAVPGATLSVPGPADVGLALAFDRLGLAPARKDH